MTELNSQTEDGDPADTVPCDVVNGLLTGRATWSPPPGLSWDGCMWRGQRAAEISYPADGQIATDYPGGGWWFDARASLIARYLAESGPHKSVWDVGGGNGVMAASLRARGCPPIVVVEPMVASATTAAPRAPVVFAAGIEDIDLPAASLSAVLLLDVLEHVQDPSRLLRTVARLLTDTGVLVVTVPAHMILWSAVDEASGHYRRYSRGLLRHTLQGVGLKVTSMRHAFASLFLPALIARRLPRSQTPGDALRADRKRLNPAPIVTQALVMLSAAERRIPDRLVPPFGTSIIAVARRDSPWHGTDA